MPQQRRALGVARLPQLELRVLQYKQQEGGYFTIWGLDTPLHASGLKLIFSLSIFFYILYYIIFVIFLGTLTKGKRLYSNCALSQR